MRLATVYVLCVQRSSVPALESSQLTTSHDEGNSDTLYS
jgi:hypothetical protein